MNNFYSSIFPRSVNEMTNGLTKLEYFTAAAMQGILSTMPADCLKKEQIDSIATEAIICARNVLKYLEAEAGR